jgi:CheY-like chemotaxis protein
MSKTMCRAMNKNKNSHAVEPPGAPRPGRTNSPCRILVVDRNSDLRVLYADALAGPACRVDVVEEGGAAWAALQAHRYHLLITENELPNLTGEELIKKLRSARMDLPVVIVAGNLPAEEPARNPSLPCAATLLKPFALDALLDTVKKVLAIPLKIRVENGSTIMAAGRHFGAKDGKTPAGSTNLWVKDLIQLDEFQAVMETFASEAPPAKS